MGISSRHHEGICLRLLAGAMPQLLCRAIMTRQSLGAEMKDVFGEVSILKSRSQIAEEKQVNSIARELDIRFAT
ncbi:MAG: hypothetical protein ACLRSW_16950 [Christensenellaceae bacterium]